MGEVSLGDAIDSGGQTALEHAPKETGNVEGDLAHQAG
jgi:hypothetical protein